MIKHTPRPFHKEKAYNFCSNSCFCCCVGFPCKPSINRFVVSTMQGSAFASGRPVTDEELASFTISDTGKRVREDNGWVVPGPGVSREVGDAMADGPHEDKSGVWVSCQEGLGGRSNLEWGVMGVA